MKHQLLLGICSFLICGIQAYAQPAGAQQPNVAEQFQDWTFRCFGGGQPRCELFQNRIDPRTKQPLFWVEYTRHASGQVQLAVITPLGSRIADGVNMSIDGKFSWSIPIKSCLPLGCLAHVDANKVLLDRIRRGRILVATVTTMSGEKVPLQLSLGGFDQGMTRLEGQLKSR